jgi:hypothetical protein
VRILFLLAALVLLATFIPRSAVVELTPPPVSWVTFDPVPLREDSPRERRLGGLVYLGGWSLTSNDHRFGAVSAIHVEGGRMLAVSDAGLAFDVPLAERGRVRIGVTPLEDGPGKRERKASRDSESLAVSGGTAWIGFEQANAVWRYSLPGWRGTGGATPKAMSAWHENRGPEAMLRLPDGRFLIFSEGEGGDSEVLVFDRDPTSSGARVSKAVLSVEHGFKITDAAALDDGRILFLSRRFGFPGGFTARLTIGRLPPLREGAVLEGELLAEFAPPFLTDNFEGLSVTREGGRTILWIASDDNYINRLQRTLLLKFAL